MSEGLTGREAVIVDAVRTPRGRGHGRVGVRIASGQAGSSGARRGPSPS